MHEETAVNTKLDSAIDALNKTVKAALSFNEMEITTDSTEAIIKNDKIKKDHSSCKGCDGICCKKKSNDKVHPHE